MANVPARRGGWPRRWRPGWPFESWDPWADFAQMWERMRPLMEQTGEAAPGEWVPMAETEDTGDAYLVRAELPGFQSDDVNVEIRGEELYISGEMKDEEKRENALRRRTGRFSYRTALPGDADKEKIDAKLADGVLTVRVPKSTPAQARKIEISK